MLMQGVVGTQKQTSGSTPILRMGEQTDLIVSQLHSRFYEQNARGNVYSHGAGVASINNVTYTTGTLGATCTPIIGVWNPQSSGVNLVILQATLGLTMTALNTTGGGPYVWAVSAGNNAITTGAFPINRKSFITNSSLAKGFYGGVALTGLSTSLTVLGASALCGGSASSAAFTATAVAMQTQQVSSTENIDGSIIVPPGGVLALLATTTPVAHSAAPMIVYEEVPLLSA